MSDDISANKEPLRERNWDAFAAVIAAMIGIARVGLYRLFATATGSCSSLAAYRN